ncbi:2-amino-4-hydroxy-6-hydroxymethyldihydropteridine diphosphokinase [Parvularcula lutaonensis]|uniref:2-amino-4-hydroxy-6-hydroxymethyldihydropteridine pyrophosphokinase n=1 Tax=Parvularcula lutaonensis TaxID=491923 RepID=A0ABV7MCZ3_9PROT|nr:2-amino-4-hydroxy-6-hydroxymethyldihydropteridine diphosphokinase [Parvularcula lutaonensis]GGY51370.1 2-amino-4-hydroxy-6-hydroxymethyldihydropteridine diphosphokinase [Parvularcula lutaonensis]
MTNALRLALVGLGSNKPWRDMPSREILMRAAEELKGLGRAVSLSPLYRSPAWPDPAEPEYTNAVAAVETALMPLPFLHGLQAIETRFGRVRSEDPRLRYAPRTLDLDLLAMGDEVVESEELALPHPRIAKRDFVLLPLRDLAPRFRHPATDASVAEMIAALPEITAKPL